MSWINALESMKKLCNFFSNFTEICAETSICYFYKTSENSNNSRLKRFQLIMNRSAQSIICKRVNLWIIDNASVLN